LENVFFQTGESPLKDTSLTNHPESVAPISIPTPSFEADRSTPVAAKEQEKESDATLTLEHLFPVDSELPSDQFFPSFYELFPDEAPVVSDSGLSFHDLFPDQHTESKSSDDSTASDESMLTLEHLF
jgi:hypothetical protein